MVPLETDSYGLPEGAKTTCQTKHPQ